MGRLMARRRPSRLLRVSLGFAGAVFLAGLLVALSGPSGMSGMDRVVYGLLSAFGVAMVAGRALDGLLAGYSVSVVGFPRSDERRQLGPGYMFGALMLSRRCGFATWPRVSWFRSRPTLCPMAWTSSTWSCALWGGWWPW